MQFLMEHWAVLLGIALFALILVTSIPWSKLMPAFKWPTIGTTTTTSETDEDALDLQAFKRLTARYERLGCKEGIEAMKVAGSHFLHSEGHA